MMEKLKYWISNIMGRGDNYCRSFCPGCKYFEICKADKSEGGNANE